MKRLVVLLFVTGVGLSCFMSFKPKVCKTTYGSFLKVTKTKDANTSKKGLEEVGAYKHRKFWSLLYF